MSEISTNARKTVVNFFDGKKPSALVAKVGEAVEAAGIENNWTLTKPHTEQTFDSWELSKSITPKFDFEGENEQEADSLIFITSVLLAVQGYRSA
ncbi:MAG: hypothetical protein H9W81_07625 [Enterococcus sp.]|nr:hypothetical protein [Enterococcus sp.]